MRVGPRGTAESALAARTLQLSSVWIAGQGLTAVATMLRVCSVEAQVVRGVHVAQKVQCGVGCSVR